MAAACRIYISQMILMAGNSADLQATLQDPNEASLAIGFEMNKYKTKIMSNLSRDKEIARRIQLGRAAFGKLEDFFKSKISQSPKTKVYNQCVLPILTYGAEVATKEYMHKIKVAQRTMKRTMLGISLVDRISDVDIRQRTRVIDVGMRIASLKWRWAGHVAKQDDDRWIKAVTELYPVGARCP
ncbi:uncharacterized protein LOC113236093 [Hyposmocoma kahamanoa]|uniref:uncharacterized protein LOC113236093 n=1 Tax=Hyposmocoma kahamanoa TaxID=1477025 RepID=UPI000E6D7A75|nr:uncharacterized protein LOC113236093 [Hyposmocoma kahamanoa]